MCVRRMDHWPSLPPLSEAHPEPERFVRILKPIKLPDHVATRVHQVVEHERSHAMLAEPAAAFIEPGEELVIAEIDPHESTLRNSVRMALMMRCQDGGQTAVIGPK